MKDRISPCGSENEDAPQTQYCISLLTPNIVFIIYMGKTASLVQVNTVAFNKHF